CRSVSRVRGGWDLVCAAFTRRRLRALAVGVRLTRAGEAAPLARGAEYAAGRRGHPRSAYEAPRAAVDRSTRFIGAESKRRGCPRLPARQSRVTLLVWERDPRRRSAGAGASSPHRFGAGERWA